MTWIYLGKETTELDLASWVAFVYEIEHLRTGKRYFGKKRLRRKVTRKPLKGKKRKRITYQESDWRTYWGSNDILAEDIAKYGEHEFTRTIIRLCKTLAESSYYEAKAQIDNGVLLSNNFYNDWVQLRVHRTHMKCVA